MTPSDFPEANRVFRIHRGEVAMPVAAEPAGVMISVWEPTPEEREAIAKGARIEIALATRGQQPPMAVAVYGVSGYYHPQPERKLTIEVG